MNTVEGVFVEQPTDPHVAGRHELLASGAPLPPPAMPVLPYGADDFPDTGAEALLAQVLDRGIGVLQLDRPLSGDRLRRFGALLGRALPETDPAVRQYVEDGVVLNLRTEHDRTRDVSLQPFASNYLTLHSEGSGRPVAEQPRYIVLMCCEAGVDSAAQTVVVPMATVAGRLSGEQAALLARIRYRHAERGPWILRVWHGRPVLSFRDFAAEPLEWTYTGDGSVAGDAVNSALRALLAAMYAPGLAVGVRWAPGLLLVIDNTHFFHGRTAGVAATAGRRRHLKRLRILPAGPQ